MRKCYYCGSKFTPSLTSIDSVACPECSKSHPKILNSDKYQIVTCKHCGVEFVAPTRRSASFCSRECYQEQQRVLRSHCMLTPEEKQATRATKYCEVCGKLIGPDRGLNAKTCSRSCSKKLGSIRTREATFGEWGAPEEKKPPKKKCKFTLGEVSRICSALHIQYAEYRKLEETGQLESFAEANGVNLQDAKKPIQRKPILKQPID